MPIEQRRYQENTRKTMEKVSEVRRGIATKEGLKRLEREIKRTVEERSFSPRHR